MSLGQKVAANLPLLRRYARALTGSQEAGDGLVRTTLEAALADAAFKNEDGNIRIALYRVFHGVWSDTAAHEAPAERDNDNPQVGGAQRSLATTTPRNRQALLLTTVEEFSSEQAGQIMGLSTSDIDALVAEAIAEIEREQATQVLVIEDEPMISMQIEDLVLSLGHTVCGTATTRDEAVEVAKRNPPGLVLADIQLADGSSGMDAVDDIMHFAEVPVIFITAYPERLLTGDREEPTYLVTKPFDEKTVQAAISQALFFQSGVPVGS
ncbi:MAG: response regulator [Pseudomonadota bacterium]